MLGTTTKLSMLFQVLHGVVVTCTLERILFLDFKLGLAVTEIIKKYRNKRTKKTLNVK